MSTVTTAAHPGIFNKSVSKEVASFVTTDMMRILFFCRMAQTQLSNMGKADFLNEDLKKSVHTAAETLRQLDMKTRSKLDPAQAKWLSEELKKDKLADICNLVELGARVSNDGNNEDYEGLMSMMTNFLDRTVHLQSQKKKINTFKYAAIFRFLTEEMRAEAEGGITAVEYNPSTDSLSFLLVQPDAQIPAKPAN